MADPIYQADIEKDSKPLPQLDSNSYPSQLFWLAVVFTVLYLVMARSTIPRIREVLTKRQSQIQHDLDTAEKAKAEAITAKASYEAELAAAKQKANDLLQQSQREIDELIAREHAELGVQLDAILRDSEATINAQRDEAVEEIKPLAAELSGMLAKQFLSKAPTKTQINKAMKAAEAS